MRRVFVWHGWRLADAGGAERCLLHDSWSGRTGNDWNRKGRGDLRHGKSVALARHRGVARVVSPNPETYLLRCIARSATPRFASRKIAFASLHFFIYRGICASREHSTVALGENVIRALSCGRLPRAWEGR